MEGKRAILMKISGEQYSEVGCECIGTRLYAITKNLDVIFEILILIFNGPIRMNGTFFVSNEIKLLRLREILILGIS